MNSLKKIGLSLFVTTLAIQETFADGCAIFGCAKADPLNTGGSGENAIMTLIKSLLQFITIIAVLFVIYAGFQLMTAGGDEEKMKKAKTIIIQVVVGIIVVWVAYSIVSWVISALTTK